MDYITTTDLRTKSPQLVATLKNGGSVSLVHRSKVIGKILPQRIEQKPFNAAEFLRRIESCNFPKTTYAQREKIYRAAMMK